MGMRHPPNSCKSRRPMEAQGWTVGEEGEGNRKSRAWPPGSAAPGLWPTSGSLSLSVPPPRGQPQAYGAGVLVLSFQPRPCHQARP